MKSWVTRLIFYTVQLKKAFKKFFWLSWVLAETFSIFIVSCGSPGLSS